MTAPRRFNFAPPLRGLVLKRNPAIVPVDASADMLNMSYGQGEFGTRRGFYVRRRLSTTLNGLPGRYGTLVRLTDGAIFPYFAHNGSIYQDVGVDYLQSTISGMTGWDPWRVPAIVNAGHAIIVNGFAPAGAAKTARTWDGTTAEDAGLTAPSATSGSTSPGAATPTTTLRADFTGNIFVRVTFGSDTWGVESEPSPAERIGSAAYSGKVQLTINGIPTSASARVGYRNIWVSIDGGLVYYLASKIQNNTSTSVTIQQWDYPGTKLAQKGGFFAAASVPNGDVMCVHEGRLFVAVGNTLYWSLKGSPEVFHPLAQLSFQDPMGITFLKSHGGRLLVAGRSNVWSLEGTFDMDDAGASSYTGKHLSDGVGVVGREAGDNAGTMLFFMSDQGLMSQAGDEAPVPLSDENIEPIIRKMVAGRLHECHVTYYPGTGEVLALIPTTDSQNQVQNQRVISYRQKGEVFGYQHLRAAWIGKAYDDPQTLDLFAFDYHGNVLRLNYGHGDGLQGDEAYGKTVAGAAQQVDEGIKLLSVASGVVLTLDTTNLPTDNALRGIQLTIVDQDDESPQYGQIETHKVLANDQSDGTVTIEDPLWSLSLDRSRHLRVYLGGIEALNVTARSDFGTPGARKVLDQVEVGLMDPTRRLQT